MSVSGKRSEFGLRPEWVVVNAVPRYSCCPLVVDIDAANNALDHLEAQGLIQPLDAARQRVILQMRRVLVSETQAVHQCTRCSGEQLTTEQSAASGEQGDQQFNCNLPVGRVGDFALGGQDVLNFVPTNDMGFVRPSKANDQKTNP